MVNRSFMYFDVNGNVCNPPEAPADDCDKAAYQRFIREVNAWKRKLSQPSVATLAFNTRRVISGGR